MSARGSGAFLILRRPPEGNRTLCQASSNGAARSQEPDPDGRRGDAFLLGNLLVVKPPS